MSGTVYAGPTNGVPAAPTFRTIVNADLPFLYYHEEFAPVTSQTQLTLLHSANVLLIVALNGTVLRAATDYSSSGQFVNFGSAFTTGDHVVIAYVGQTGVFAAASLTGSGLLTSGQTVKAAAALSAAATRVTSP